MRKLESRSLECSGRSRRRGVVLFAGAIALASVLPARAEVLIGGASVGTAKYQWTAPGINQTFSETPFLDAEAATQVPMPAGTLTKLRFSVKPKGQNGGSARIRAYLNGAMTDLSCMIDVSGDCTSTVFVPVSEGALLNVRIINNLKKDGLANPDGIVFTYSLDFD